SKAPRVVVPPPKRRDSAWPEVEKLFWPEVEKLEGDEGPAPGAIDTGPFFKPPSSIETMVLPPETGLIAAADSPPAKHTLELRPEPRLPPRPALPFAGGLSAPPAPTAGRGAPVHRPSGTLSLSPAEEARAASKSKRVLPFQRAAPAPPAPE